MEIFVHVSDTFALVLSFWISSDWASPLLLKGSFKEWINLQVSAGFYFSQTEFLLWPVLDSWMADQLLNTGCTAGNTPRFLYPECQLINLQLHWYSSALTTQYAETPFSIWWETRNSSDLVGASVLHHPTSLPLDSEFPWPGHQSQRASLTLQVVVLCVCVLERPHFYMK